MIIICLKIQNVKNFLKTHFVGSGHKLWTALSPCLLDDFNQIISSHQTDSKRKILMHLLYTWSWVVGMYRWHVRGTVIVVCFSWILTSKELRDCVEMVCYWYGSIPLNFFFFPVVKPDLLLCQKDCNHAGYVGLPLPVIHCLCTTYMSQHAQLWPLFLLAE